MFNLPSQASDAGPDYRAPQADWRDLIDQATELLHAAERCNRDDRDAEHKLRREHLEAARDKVTEALNLLPDPNERLVVVGELFHVAAKVAR